MHPASHLASTADSPSRPQAESELSKLVKAAEVRRLRKFLGPRRQPRVASSGEDRRRYLEGLAGRGRPLDHRRPQLYPGLRPAGEWQAWVAKGYPTVPKFNK